jgi:hypothetical protein
MSGQLPGSPERGSLNIEEYAILDHTIHRAARNCYYGSKSDPWMTSLVDKGYMTPLGGGYRDDESYYTITPKGRAAHQIGVTEK